ncbi:MAG: hypothetical protein ACXWDI_11900 [Nocardioides sp.]
MASNMETDTNSGEQVDYVDQPEGPVAAAILASGVGALALGMLTTLAEASTSIKDLLSFYDPVGPLSGKTIGAVVAWLVAWGVLHMMWREKAVEASKVLTATLVLIGLGVLGTFPIFFQAFAPAE